MTHTDNHQGEEQFLHIQEKIQLLKAEIQKQIIGQEELIDTIIIALLSNGHTLLEWLPGLAKTRTVSTLATALDMWFKRIQFTPDLLPSDVLWAEIFNVKNGNFEIKKWPIFANFILADEINRAPSKVQSALLEAMAEKQITIGNETFPLEQPFLVLATQNPIEQSGTYSLPEAQLDRFMFKVQVTYPTKSEEQLMYKNILEQTSGATEKILQKDDIFHMQELIKTVFVSENIYEYVADIIDATRYPEKVGLTDIQKYIGYGSSPRWWLALIAAAKAKAAIDGRNYVIPEDIKSLAKLVLSHRIILSYDAIAEDITVDYVLEEILKAVNIV